MECALWTDVSVSAKKNQNTGNLDSVNDSESAASVRAWIQVRQLDNNDIPIGSYVNVPVTNDSNGDGKFDDPDNGIVVMCDRSFRIATNILEQIQEICFFLDATFTEFNECSASYLNLYLRTNSAHSFNWIQLNLGSGTWELRVVADLQANVSGDGTAVAAVGKRTLTAIPGKLANDVNV